MTICRHKMSADPEAIKMEKIAVYVLECEGNKFYVGKSLYSDQENAVYPRDLEDETAWTKLHKPVRFVGVITDCSDDAYEDELTLEYMEKYGIDNVRGGSFSSIDLDDKTRTYIRRMISSPFACYKCRSPEHYTSECDQSHLTREVKIETDCELEGMNYFKTVSYVQTNLRNVPTQRRYCLNFPGVFGSADKNDYEIYLYTETPNDNMRTIGITLSEYLNMVNEFFDLAYGTYDEERYTSAIRKYDGNYRRSDGGTKRQMGKIISGAVKALLCKKLGIENIKTIKSWCTSYWTQSCEERLMTMADGILDDDIGHIGFKIVFGYMTFVSFVTYSD